MHKKKSMNKDEKDCTACTACMNICPDHAINMTKDQEGFWKVYVDKTKCSECNLCMTVCHLMQDRSVINNSEPVYYAAFSKDADNVEQSSSGGIFFELCKNILKCSGIVYGAVQTTMHEVKHQRAETLEEAALFRRSKYLESDLGTCYEKVKQDLEENRKVLFSGVACQIAGLYAYLRKDYKNLYTCEVVCHGVPSYLAYEKYLKEKSDKYGSRIDGINFRDKSFGWNNNAICEYFENGESDISYSNLHPLHSVYLKGINMKKSCGSCSYAHVPRVGDITLADFWRYKGKLAKQSANRGLSLIAVNNKHGEQLLSGISNYIYFEKTDKREALGSCRHMDNTPLVNESQEAFMWLLQKTSFHIAADICLNFGPVIRKKRLCKMKGIDEDYIWDTFWRDEQEIIYVLDGDDRLKGIVTYGSFIRNYENKNAWVNYCFRKVIFSEDCIQEINAIFGSEKKINRIPVIDSIGRLIFEVRRNDAKIVPYQMDEKFLKTAMKYEAIFNKKHLIILNERKQWEKEDIFSCKFLVDTICKKNILKRKYQVDSVYGKDYQEEMEMLRPFLQSYYEGIDVYFIKRPDLLLDYKYSDEEKTRINEEKSFPRLSEDIIGNENILKSLFKEKFSYAYIEELRKIPQIVEKNNRYQHIDYSSRYVNVVGGYRKTRYQPWEFCYTIHVYGRCGVFGYAVEDSETIPSVLQELFTNNNKKIRVINHGLWGADNKKILHNLSTDIEEGIIKKEDKIVLYMDYLPYMERLDNLNVFIQDSTLPFHEYKKDKVLFYDKPGHMTAEGYQYMAGFMYEVLTRSYIKKIDKNKRENVKKFLLYYTKTYKKKKQENLNERELEKYLSEVKAELSKKMDLQKKTGAIVMNCNPFTKGHRYLIEIASREVDNLLIFVLEEDKSFFTFSERFQMVKSGTEDLENVHVLPSGKFMISALTFPEYFIKEQKQDIKVNPITDVQIFARSIAPELHITVRFVGTEPRDKITDQYNSILKEQLLIYGIDLREIDRLEEKGQIITATEVRKLLKENKHEKLMDFVPLTTYDCLKNFGYL